MTQIKESGEQQNINISESLPQSTNDKFSYPVDAEKVNGRWAMIGFIALIGAYLTTGQIIPGIY
tara:strand:- start:821 stop:1012 length:192 start_codon:yes stop_codon:yes gene_type:complete